ncbi:GNAT family N-acetyltransferase [Pseudocnuella soli]|uniref:GNAT family N-acetyltransferase n=1 Tax=Pseudocnuella soli TaxID=2502779 RepID=UPI00104D3CB9|nr:GNAT family protein [Pseudocnuella soli]
MFSQRFKLEAFQPADQAFVFEGLSHPDVIRYYGVQFHSYEATRVQMEWFEHIIKENSGHWWKIVSLQNGDRVGAIGMNNYQPQHRCTEIGYWLLPPFWKKGIISEVLPLVLQYLFTGRNMHRVAASVEVGNDASSKVLERAGFRLEGVQRDCEFKNGGLISLKWYSLLESEWRMLIQ